MNKTISIVICTYNRDVFLERTLKSLERLTYKDLEVVVVNGPSTDNTQDVIDKYSKTIKTAGNPETNLSVSRNIGIKLSSGDIVAFIDDDAIPEEDWLDDLVDYYNRYEGSNVAGVGGKVYGPGGDHFQFANGYLDLEGNVTAISDKPQDFNNPKEKKFNHLLGTNCSFRRDVLLEVGGFDEFIEYFADETELCVRIIKAGYKIVHHPRAFIHHEFAKSHIRANTYDPYHYNWYPIIKNEIYHMLKDAEGLVSDEKRRHWADVAARKRLNAFHDWHRSGHITDAEHTSFVETWNKAYMIGMEAGMGDSRKLNFDMISTVPFMKFDPSLVEEQMTICLLSKDNIFEAMGGVAKYTFELAKGFVSEGHQVHIVTKGSELYDYMKDGINVHCIPLVYNLSIKELKPYPTAHELVQYAYCAYKRIVALNMQYSFDIVESPLWDFEGAVAAYMLRDKLPVVVRLQTPLLKVAETQQWKLTDDHRIHADFERTLIHHAAGIISISDSIQNTIEDMYSIAFDKNKIEKVYLGVDGPKFTAGGALRRNDRIQILFVGRLERRKGVHTIMSVISMLMEKYHNIEFVFVGDDTAEDRRLKTTFRSHFLQKYGDSPWVENIIFTGKINNERKEAYYDSCDFLIAPSLYESFGIILIEAMSCKKPVIACNIGGMKEIVRDGVDGILIEPENEKQLGKAIENMIESKELREKMGRSSRDRYLECFTNEKMILGTLKAYKKFINEQQHS
jgi:glycosyltransferase involved in cell wall biosynthesis